MRDGAIHCFGRTTGKTPIKFKMEGETEHLTGIVPIKGYFIQ